MNTYKKNLNFLDANGLRISLDVEITERNHYPEFTVSGNMAGSGGQIIDSIKPATDKQKELLDLWRKYHLKDISKIHNFKENLISVCEVIEYDEAKRAGSAEIKQGDEKILELMGEYDIDESELHACKAYLEAMGIDELSDFQESYRGEFANDEEFAKNEAEQCGLLDDEIEWPHSFIDWERATHALMKYCTEQDGFYFRNL